MKKYFFQYAFLIIFIIGSAYSPMAYAGGVVTAVTSVVAPVVNFVVDTAAIVVDLTAAAVITVVAWPVTGLCMIGVGGACDVLGSMINPFTNDAACRNPFGGPVVLQGGQKCQPSNAPPSPLPNLTPVATTSVSTFSYTGGSSTCTSVTLSGINAQGHNYAVLRDGNIIAQLPASQTSYADTNLTPHTNYQYKIRIPYPPEVSGSSAGGGAGGSANPSALSPAAGIPTADSAPVNAYTQCLPQCSFGVVSSSVAKFGTTNLRWVCQYNAVSADGGRCAISDSSGFLNQSVDSVSGSLAVTISANNQYTLKCGNKDGSISIPQGVSVFTPGLKEIKP